MSLTPVKRPVYLLPNYFKWIGTGILVIAVVVFIVQTQSQFLSSDEDYGIPATLILAGLALINFAKEKIEDERIRKIRYRTWAYSFYTIIGWVLFGRILNFFLDSPLEYYNSATSILISILMLNLAIFTGNKEIDVDEE